VILDQLEQWWTALLELTSHFVVPDWGALVDLMPIFLLIGVVGPIVTLLMVLWFIYIVRKPRIKVSFAEVRRPAELDAAGNAVYPAGEPYSPTERMIYEPGATRSESGESLLVACPKCSLVRSAAEDTCGNCGLSFTIKPTVRLARRAGPPSGGAAAA